MKSKIKSLRVSFILVTLLYLLWGLANNMNDTLLAAFKRIMSLSDLQTSLVQFAFYGSYFCFALPAALYIRKYSYKSGIMLGLLIYAAGTMLFTPASKTGSYGFFLIAIYVMAAGCSILETTANPLIISLGSPQTATRRLNIAQSFNPLGAIIGILLSRHLILSKLHSVDASSRSSMLPADLAIIQTQEFDAVSGTYFLIGCVLIVLTVIIAFTAMNGERDTSTATLSVRSLMGILWRNKRYRYGIVAQFFYVGAQTCVWSFTIRLVMEELTVREAAASDYFMMAIVLFTLCRFLFTLLMKYYSPAKLLTISTVCAITSTLLVILGKDVTAICGLVAISAFMSLMFPTIYGLALDGIGGNSTKLASSGLIMSIVGGALITPVQGLVSDMTGDVSVSFCVPLVCFIVILIYSFAIVYGADD
ncbi:MAG: L-fucose:H+ symporter permease [Muribaculaceae bacterium]|nr:L-fucose:H+ symporter permease [Muribaculaceae bacterium]